MSRIDTKDLRELGERITSSFNGTKFLGVTAKDCHTPRLSADELDRLYALEDRHAPLGRAGIEKVLVERGFEKQERFGDQVFDNYRKDDELVYVYDDDTVSFDSQVPIAKTSLALLDAVLEGK